MVPKPAMAMVRRLIASESRHGLLRVLVSKFPSAPVPATQKSLFHDVATHKGSANGLDSNFSKPSMSKEFAGRQAWVRSSSVVTTVAEEVVVLEHLSGSEEGVAVLTLNRPHVKNAIGQELLTRLQASIESLQFDDSARVLLVRSAVPGVFCAGADLKERRKLDRAGAQKYFQILRSTFTELESLSIPTIAVVEGAALGGGLELALACDLRVCGDEAVFGFPETGHGIIPGAGGTQRLPRLINQALAKELIFTGRRISGHKAEEIGLVNHCVQAGSAYQKALDIAHEIIKQGPLAVKLAKVAVGRGSEVDTASGMVIEEACYVQTFKSKDRLEGLAAFAEKRKPIYSGE